MKDMTISRAFVAKASCVLPGQSWNDINGSTFMRMHWVCLGAKHRNPKWGKWNRMKDTPLSNSERDFLLKAIEDKKVRRFRNFTVARKVNSLVGNNAIYFNTTFIGYSKNPALRNTEHSNFLPYNFTQSLRAAPGWKANLWLQED